MAGQFSIRAVVFDLDDTLYAERDYVRSGYLAVQSALEEMLARPCRDAGDWLWRRFQRGQSGGAFDAINDCFSLGLSAADIASLVRAYRDHLPTIRPYGGAAGMLALLHAHVRLGLLSDGFMPAQRLKLEALKLQRFFDAVVFTEELGENREFWKPSPRAFEAISKQLGATGAACAYVGDNPAKDFVAPNALGWRTIQFLRPGRGQLHAAKTAPPGGQPDVVVHNMAELRQTLLEPLIRNSYSVSCGRKVNWSR